MASEIPRTSSSSTDSYSPIPCGRRKILFSETIEKRTEQAFSSRSSDQETSSNEEAPPSPLSSSPTLKRKRKKYIETPVDRNELPTCFNSQTSELNDSPLETRWFHMSQRGSPGFSPGTARQSKVIYCLRNKNGEAYVGKTDREVKARMGEHRSLVLHPERDTAQSPLYADIRSGKPFFIGVLYQLQPDDDINDCEKYFIELLNSYEEGYNKNRGGGGGSSSDEATSAAPSSPYVPTVSHTPKSPDVKAYPFSPTLQVQLTPGTAKETKSVIYAIKDNRIDPDTGNKGIYIGKTKQFIRQRAAQHSSNARAEGKDRGRGLLYEAMRERPADFSLIVLENVPASKLFEAERFWIKLFGEDENYDLYNCNGGGGGSS